MTGRSQIWDGAQWVNLSNNPGSKGETGATGPPGEGGELSTDAGNQAILGSDSLHYVPEFADGVYLKLTGGTISGQVDFNADTDHKGNRLKNVGTTAVGTDGLSRVEADGLYLRLNGSSAMTGNLSMGDNQLLDVEVVSFTQPPSFPFDPNYPDQNTIGPYIAAAIVGQDLFAVGDRWGTPETGTAFSNNVGTAGFTTYGPNGTRVYWHATQTTLLAASVGVTTAVRDTFDPRAVVNALTVKKGLYPGVDPNQPAASLNIPMLLGDEVEAVDASLVYHDMEEDAVGVTTVVADSAEVNPRAMMAILVAALQDLDARVDTLESP